MTQQYPDLYSDIKSLRDSFLKIFLIKIPKRISCQSKVRQLPKHSSNLSVILGVIFVCHPVSQMLSNHIVVPKQPTLSEQPPVAGCL